MNKRCVEQGAKSSVACAGWCTLYLTFEDLGRLCGDTAPSEMMWMLSRGCTDGCPRVVRRIRDVRLCSSWSTTVWPQALYTMSKFWVSAPCNRMCRTAQDLVREDSMLLH